VISPSCRGAGSRDFSPSSAFLYWAVRPLKSTTSTVAHTRKTPARRGLHLPDIRFGSKREQSDQRYTFVHARFALKATVDLKHRLAVRHKATSRSRQSPRRAFAATDTRVVPLNSYSSSKTNIHVHKHPFTYMGKL